MNPCFIISMLLRWIYKFKIKYEYAHNIKCILYTNLYKSVINAYKNYYNRIADDVIRYSPLSQLSKFC